MREGGKVTNRVDAVLAKRVFNLVNAYYRKVLACVCVCATLSGFVPSYLNLFISKCGAYSFHIHFLLLSLSLSLFLFLSLPPSVPSFLPLTPDTHSGARFTLPMSGRHC